MLEIETSLFRLRCCWGRGFSPSLDSCSLRRPLMLFDSNAAASPDASTTVEVSSQWYALLAGIFSRAKEVPTSNCRARDSGWWTVVAVEDARLPHLCRFPFQKARIFVLVLMNHKTNHELYIYRVHYSLLACRSLIKSSLRASQLLIITSSHGRIYIV